MGVCVRRLWAPRGKVGRVIGYITRTSPAPLPSPTSLAGATSRVASYLKHDVAVGSERASRISRVVVEGHVGGTILSGIFKRN